MNKSGNYSSEILANYPLTKPYKLLFDELSKKKYVVRNVYQHYLKERGIPDKYHPTVVLRIDVDNCFHLSWPLALHLHYRGLTASHYFLTHAERYYNLWISDIPKKIAKLGQEVGLHSDHYYEQIVFGKNGLEELCNDVIKLSNLCGKAVRGMVYHGHNEVNNLGVTNWLLTKDLNSSVLGLEYHDGLKSCYIDPNSSSWKPKCDACISDYMGISNSWGWNYKPYYPIRCLKKYAKPNSTFHIAFHTKNPFRYWMNWPDTYEETPRSKESRLIFICKKLKISYLLSRTHLSTFLKSLKFS